LLIDKGADIGDFGQIFTDSSGAVMYALAEEGDAAYAQVFPTERGGV